MPGPRRLRLSNVILSNASFTKTGWDLKPHIWNTLVSECELNLLDKPIVSLTVYVGLCVCVCACVRTGETVKAALYTRMSHTTLQSSSFSPLRGKERQRNQRRLNSPPGVTSSRHSIFVFRPLTSFCVFTQFTRHIPCESEITDVILDNSEWFMWALWCSAKHQHST